MENFKGGAWARSPLDLRNNLEKIANTQFSKNLSLVSVVGEVMYLLRQNVA